MCSVSLRPVPWAGLRSVNVVFPGHTLLIFGTTDLRIIFIMEDRETHQSISGAQGNRCSPVVSQWEPQCHVYFSTGSGDNMKTIHALQRYAANNSSNIHMDQF